MTAAVVSGEQATERPLGGKVLHKAGQDEGNTLESMSIPQHCACALVDGARTDRASVQSSYYIQIIYTP